MTALDETTATAMTFVLVMTLIMSTITDLMHHRIPNLILLPALTIALVAQITVGGAAGLFSAVAGLLVGLILLLPLYVMGGMGAGDVKLLAVAGAFLGPWGTAVAGAVTLVAGGLYAILFLAWRAVRPVLERYTWQLRNWNVDCGVAPSMIAASATQAQTGFAYAPAIATGVLYALWQQGWLGEFPFV